MNSAKSMLQLLFIAMVVLVAAWQLYSLIPFLDMDRIQELLAIILLGILAEWLSVSFPHGQLSGVFALFLAAYLLFGPAAAAWVAGLSTLLGQGIANRGNPIRATMFNSGQSVLAVVAAGYAYQWCAGSGLFVGETGINSWLPVLVFTLSYLLINHALIFIYLLPNRRDYPGQSWQDAMKWDGLTYLFTVPLGLLIAMIFPSTALTGLLLLFFPVLILQLIMRHYIHLNVANKELKVFHDVATYLKENPRPDQLLEFILLRVREVFSYQGAVAYLLSGNRGAYSPVASFGHYAKYLNQAQVFHGEGVIGEAIKERKPEIVSDCAQDPRTRNGDGWYRLMRSLLIIPLLSGKEELGVIVLGELRPAGFDETHLRIMTVLGRQTVMTIEKELAVARLEHGLSLDFLTGMLHAGAFFQVFQEMCQNCDESDVFGIMLLDIDDFKRINNQYGRTGGDRLLTELAPLIDKYLRLGDLAARYGGDEFILVLRQIQGKQLKELAIRLREQIREQGFLTNIGRQARITVSIGLAEYPQDAVESADLLQAVQKALDQAKKEGHNRIGERREVR